MPPLALLGLSFERFVDRALKEAIERKDIAQH
jgi:hypothetical protein